MSAICGACSISFERDGSEVTCSGLCERYFHAECVKEDVESKKTRSAWKCKDCRVSSQSSVKSSLSSEAQITKEFLRQVLDGFKDEVFGELKSFRKEMSELKSSTQFLSDTVETANSLMSQLKTEFAKMRKENEVLQTKNNVMSCEVEELRDRVRTLEQYTRRCNVEISGVPVTANESVPVIVKDVGAALGVPVRDVDIAAAHRIPSFKKDVIPSIVVQFQHRATRDSWVSSFKKKKMLTAKEVNVSFPASKVWVNEHLSPENKLFLSKLKKKCRDIGYKYAWCRDGKFYARKSDGEKFHKIFCANDIEKLK